MGAEPQRALTQVVTGAKKEIDLRESALLGTRFASPEKLRTPNEASPSIGCSTIVRQPPRAHTTRKRLIRAQPPNVAGKWVQRYGEEILNAERSENA
jgi:hypothetical protein